ncbi:MAG: MmgE/PrpD family protein [Betaproteobacteria bacterium]|nr:MmgE/PrpD family protein [Betaproteobacteria bacterium]
MSDRTSPRYLTTLAEFACNTQLASLSDRARDRARRVIADCISVIAAGMQQREMQALVAKHLAQAARGNACVIGAGKRVAALDAALLNGTAGTWLELDEGNLFAKGHPGIQVVPAAVALAQENGASGADLLLAVALGYELSSRISRAAQVKLSVHPHGTYGVIGAAIAAGKLKGFGAAQMLELINVAATMGMATSRQTLLDGATVRNIFTGHSGYMGLMAARLVECGFTGEIDGVSAVYGKILSDTFDPAKVVAGLGSEWLIAQSYFKLHPTGRYAHSAIDALEDLLAGVPGGRLDVAQVERIEVKAYKLAAMLAEKNVVSSFGARFSVPFALASILVHGRSGLRSFDEDAVANPQVQALAKRVDLQEEASFSARFPAEQPVDLRIVMRDGAVHTGRCVVTKGEPANPHKPEELTAKFFELGEPVWGKPVTRKLYDGLMKLEDIGDFRSFADQFTL